jgi:hypothetical protein
MAVEDDDTTLDTSKSGATDDQTVQDDDSQTRTGDDSNNDNSEAHKTRGEKHHERYIDRLSNEIKQSNALEPDTAKDLFAPAKHTPLEFTEDSEFTPAELEADRKAAAEAARAEGRNEGLSFSSSKVEKQMFQDRFDIDADRVTQKWDVLVPESDNFNSKLESRLVQKYMKLVGMTRDKKGRIAIERPNVRFKEFVDEEMADRNDYAEFRGAVSNNNVTRQKAQTGLRPTPGNKSAKGGHGFDSSSMEAAGRSVAAMTHEQYFKLGGKEASDAYMAKHGIA